MAARNLIPDACVVGEPTNPKRLGEMVKIGRRGQPRWPADAFTASRAMSPIHSSPTIRCIHWCGMLAASDAESLDEGTPHFQPSNLQITSIDVGNPATNVIPAQARPSSTSVSTTGTRPRAWRRDYATTWLAAGLRYELEVSVSGEAFLTVPGPFTAIGVQRRDSR